MDFEWDALKAASNRRKHGVTFEEGVTVFGDPNAVTIPDPWHSATEEREITIGTSNHGRILVISHTFRGSVMRVISVRRASRRERIEYEEAIG